MRRVRHRLFTGADWTQVCDAACVFAATVDLINLSHCPKGGGQWAVVVWYVEA